MTDGRDFDDGAAGPFSPTRVSRVGIGLHADVRTAAARVYRSLRAMTVITGADGAALMLTDRHGRLRAVGGSSAEGMALEYAQQFERRGPAHECLAADSPVAIPDLQRHGGADYARLARRAAPVRAVLSVPVRVDGLLAGTLNFYHHAPHDWSAGQAAIAQRLADALAMLLVRLAQRPAMGRAS